MKKLIVFIAIFIAFPAFSAEKAAVQETNPPAASGPLDMASITIPADAKPPVVKPAQAPAPAPASQTPEVSGQ